MGTTYSAYAIIGVRIPSRKLFISRMDANYCSECGPRPSCQMTPIDGFNGKDTLFDMNVVASMDQEYFYVGFICSSSENRYGKDGFLEIDKMLGEIYSHLKDELEPHDLWNENDFGLWSVLRCS
jgi:hypothetical protein